MPSLTLRRAWGLTFLLVSLGLFASETDLSLRSTVVPVGTRGATLTFPAGWGRQVLNAQMGKDQFRRPDTDGFLILVELPGFLVTEDAARDGLKLRENLIRAQSPSAVFRPLSSLSTANLLFVREQADLKVDSLDLSYLLGVVSIPGARYFVMAWTYPKNFPSLAQDVNSIVGSLRGDPASRDYSARMKVTSVAATGAGSAFVLSYPDAGYDSRKPSSPALVRLYSKEEDLTVTLQPGWPGDNDAFDLEPGSATPGYRARYTASTDSETLNLLEVRLTGASSEVMELRIEGPLGKEGLSVAARALVSGLTIESGKVQEALPPEPVSESAGRTEVLALAAGSRAEGTIPDSIKETFWNSDGRPWFVTSQGAGRLVDGVWQVKARWDGDAPKGPVAVGPVTFFAAYEGQPVVAQLGSSFQEQGWSADALVEGRGRGLVGLLRNVGPSDWELPFGAGVGQTQTLVVRADGGTETTLGTFPRVADSAFDGEGQHVLVQLAHGDFEVSGRRRWDLVRVDLAGGRRILGTWDRVSTLVSADRGWVVEGRPEGKSAGVWLLGSDGRSERLAPDLGLNPVGVHDGRLWYTFPKSWEARGVSWRAQSVYSVPLDRLDSLVSRLERYTAEAINAAAAKAGLAPGYPALPSRESALALVTSVRSFLAAETGAPFPPEARFLDTLLDETTVREGLDAGGFRALTLLLAGAYLDAGAEWVGSGVFTDGFQPPVPQDSSAFRRSLFLPAVVYSALYEDEGWYDPVATVLDNRAGRTLLVGLDPRTLAQAQATDDEEPDALFQSGDRAALGRWLLDPARRTNSGLRSLVLQRLWRQGDFPGLAVVLRTLGASATGQDRLFGYLLAWQANGFVLDGREAFQRVFGAEPEAALASLKALVAETDREPMAVYLLGKAWEFSSFPWGPFNARVCYQTLDDNYRVSDPLKRLVAQDLARLGGESSD